MKKSFNEPEIKVVVFSAEDVITTSDGGFTPGQDESGMT